MKRQIIIWLQWLLPIFALGQQTALTVGDKWPAMELQQVARYSSEVIRPEAYKGKAVVLDFWATWCGTCVASMPKMAKLQERFADSVLFAYVTPQTKQVVEAFMNKRSMLKDIRVPMITGDAALLQQFPCVAVPHVVWIDATGTIKAISGGEYLNEEQVQLFLRDTAFRLPLKQDLLSYDYSKSFVLKAEDYAGLGSYSMLRKESRQLKGREGFDSPSAGYVRVDLTNCALVNMYALAISFELPVLATEIQSRLLGPDSLKALITQSLEEPRKQLYSYEAILEAGGHELADRKRLLQRMKSDLDAYLQLRTRIEKAEVPCWVIKPLPQTDTNDKGGKGVTEEGDGQVLLVNQRGSSLAAQVFACIGRTIPVLYDGPPGRYVNGSLLTQYEDLNVLQADLKRMGFRLDMEQRSLTMLRLER
jgi:thiol-disulfide isomerase/thioredoxin